MNPGKLIEILNIAENLKNNTRHSWTSKKRHESIAEHSWRLALMAYFIKDEFKNVDINKVILMCILHDIGEAFTGDIPAFEKNESHEIKEESEIQKWISSLPEPYNNELKELFKEMNELQTEESKLCKALDKLETLVQHNEAPISTWLPLEYDLQLTYGEKETQFSPYLKSLREQINNDSINKIKARK